MKISRLICLILALFVSGCASSHDGAAIMLANTAPGSNPAMDEELQSTLAGSWKLVSFHSHDASGQKNYPFGKDAQGRLIYELNGRMAVQVTDIGRPKLTSGDPLATSETEVRAAFGGYTAYYGTYSVNPAEQTITHNIEAALLPNWVGTSQKRQYEFDGKYLTLKGPLTLGGVQWVVSLKWERLP